METYAVGASTVTSPASSSSFGRMESADFLQLLVTELQQQDPFEPTKTADMIGQVSQIRSIEQSAQLVQTLEQLTQQQHTSGASELLGKYVEAVSIAADGTVSIVSGVVTSVRFGANGVALLELDTGEMVRAADVARITTLEQAEQDPAEDEPAESESDKSAATSRARGTLPERPGLWLDGSLSL